VIGYLGRTEDPIVTCLHNMDVHGLLTPLLQVEQVHPRPTAGKLPVPPGANSVAHAVQLGSRMAACPRWACGGA
jgi:hypothetical protein